MNTVTHTVTKVLSEPYFKYLWCVDVEADAWGHISKTTACFATKKDAEKCVVGYRFEA